jgi:hypothetical protein
MDTLVVLSDVAVVDLKTMSVAARHKIGKDPFGGVVMSR